MARDSEVPESDQIKGEVLSAQAAQVLSLLLLQLPWTAGPGLEAYSRAYRHSLQDL